MKRPDERRTYGKVDFGNEWRSSSVCQSRVRMRTSRPRYGGRDGRRMTINYASIVSSSDAAAAAKKTTLSDRLSLCASVRQALQRDRAHPRTRWPVESSSCGLLAHDTAAAPACSVRRMA